MRKKTNLFHYRGIVCSEIPEIKKIVSLQDYEFPIVKKQPFFVKINEENFTNKV